jgi:hypothetical protein
MKKALLSIAAAALALAPAAALAKPIWVPVSADNKCYANTSAISRETVFLHVPVSCTEKNGSQGTAIFSVDCTSWQYFLSVEGKDVYAKSQVIGRGTTGESIANLACEIVPTDRRLN